MHTFKLVSNTLQNHAERKRNCHDKSLKTLCWIQDFPEGAPTLERAPTYYLANFSLKLSENEEILGQEGARWMGAP